MTTSDIRQPRTYRVLLSGAPCSGKTTILKQLQEELYESHENLRVIIIPEAVSLVLQSMDKESLRKSTFDMRAKGIFVKSIIRMQIGMEDTYERMAVDMEDLPDERDRGDTLIVFDRGLGDGLGFCQKEHWHECAREVGVIYNANTFREGNKEPYDKIVLLETPARLKHLQYAEESAATSTFNRAKALDAEDNIKAVYDVNGTNPLVKHVKARHNFQTKKDEVLQIVRSLIDGSECESNGDSHEDKDEYWGDDEEHDWGDRSGENRDDPDQADKREPSLQEQPKLQEQNEDVSMMEGMACLSGKEVQEEQQQQLLSGKEVQEEQEQQLMGQQFSVPHSPAVVCQDWVGDMALRGVSMVATHRASISERYRFVLWAKRYTREAKDGIKLFCTT